MLSLEGFSQRTLTERRDLGRDILRALTGAAAGDPFLLDGSFLGDLRGVSQPTISRIVTKLGPAV